MHDSRILDNPVLERMQFEYLKAGFEPAWDKDPYRVFVYTTLQERATQVSHSNTGKLAGKYEPTIGTVLSNVAKEEARHYTFYRTIFKEVLKRDPNTALASAAEIMPSIDMPGVSGYSVAREVRSIYDFSPPLLIAISGKWVGQTDRMLADLAGFSHFLQKPCDPRVLLQILEPLRASYFTDTTLTPVARDSKAL